MRIFDMRANHIVNPLGFKLEPVRLSYKVDGTAGRKQAAARIVVSKRADLNEPIVDTGRRADISSSSSRGPATTGMPPSGPTTATPQPARRNGLKPAKWTSPGRPSGSQPTLRAT